MGEVVVPQKQFFKKNINVYNGNVIDVTYADLADLISEDGLDYRSVYRITDRGDNGLVFRAASTNRLESDGLRYMLCPATYATGEDAYGNDWIGVWNAVKQATATTGQLCIWNGLVWTAGATLSGDSPSTEESGWTVIPKASFTNHEYIEMIFGVTFDFENDWIAKQWDDKDNEIGINYEYAVEELGVSYNPVDITDWNTNKFFHNNKAGKEISNNNSIILHNDILGEISKNTNSEISYNKSNAITDNSGGSILNNIVLNITGNSIEGQIIYNNGMYIQTNSQLGVQVNIKNNIGFGIITGIWDADVTDAVVDKTGTAE